METLNRLSKEADRIKRQMAYLAHLEGLTGPELKQFLSIYNAASARCGVTPQLYEQHYKLTGDIKLKEVSQHFLESFSIWTAQHKQAVVQCSLYQQLEDLNIALMARTYRIGLKHARLKNQQTKQLKAQLYSVSNN